MKKIIALFTLVMGLFILSACNSNTPGGVAEQAVECIQKKDYAGYIDLMYYDDDKVPSAEEKKQFEDMLKSKAEATYEKKEGIKSYEVVTEEISEDGKEALVRMKLVFNNDEQDVDSINLKKDKEGKWRIYIGK